MIALLLWAPLALMTPEKPELSEGLTHRVPVESLFTDPEPVSTPVMA